MRIIISGGSGQIGRLVAANLAPEYEVIVLSRNPVQVRNLPAGVRAERWDGRTAQGWAKLADGAAAIINLAGENLSGKGLFPARWTPARKQLLLDSRVNPCLAVVEAIRQAEHKPRVLIQASGVGIYGPLADEEAIETTPPGRDFFATVAVKWEAATAPVESMGVRRVMLRSAVVLDPRAGALRPMMLPFRFFVGGPVGSGKQWFPWIHPHDEAAAIRFLLENEAARGPFNLVAPGILRNAEFSRALGKALGRPSWLPIPAFAMRLAFGEVADVLLTGQRARPARLLEMGFTFRFPEAEAALHDLLRRSP